MCVAGCDRCLVLTDGVSTHAHRRNKGCAESCMTKPHSLRQPMFPHLSQCSTLCSRMFDLYAAALQAAPCLLHALSSCLHNCDVICLGSHRRLSGLPGSIVVCTHRLMRKKKPPRKKKTAVTLCVIPRACCTSHARAPAHRREIIHAVGVLRSADESGRSER
jgi:hypothetical protein